MPKPIHSREVVLLESPEDVKADVHQVMNPLHPDVYNSLKESIWAEGILVPILLDKNWAVIDGHNRIQVWKDLLAIDVEIGKVPAVVYDGATKYDAYRIAVTTNSVRRDPSTLKPELVRKQLLWLDHMYEAEGDPPDDRRSFTDTRIASTIGIQKDAVRVIRAQMENSGEIATSTRRVGLQMRNGKRVEKITPIEAARSTAANMNEKKQSEPSMVFPGTPSNETPPIPPPAKIKIGRKEYTPEEVKAEVKKLQDEKSEMEKEKEGAEEKLQERIDLLDYQYTEAVAAVHAKYREEEPPPSFPELSDEAWENAFANARSVRIEKLMRHMRDITGFLSFMQSYFPDEAAEAIMDMSGGDRVVEDLDFIVGWLGQATEGAKAKIERVHSE